jgi:excisionase family DNA binding protein
MAGSAGLAPSSRTVFDVAGTAEHLGVTPRFVRKLIAEHKLGYYKIGRCVRVGSDDIDAFLAASRIEPWDVA